jgi:hypothetical protein
MVDCIRRHLPGAIRAGATALRGLWRARLQPNLDKAANGFRAVFNANLIRPGIDCNQQSLVHGEENAPIKPKRTPRPFSLIFSHKTTFTRKFRIYEKAAGVKRHGRHERQPCKKRNRPATGRLKFTRRQAKNSAEGIRKE